MLYSKVRTISKIVAIIVLIGLVSYIQAGAQRSNANIAPFKIELTNGEDCNYQQLQKDKPVMLNLFFANL
jgi:hypothetical protein